MSNFFSFLDCYFQHSSPTASRNTLNSNYSSSTLNVKSSSGPSRIFEASDYLSKDEEANQYLQSQYYRQNSQFSSRYSPYDNLPDYYHHSTSSTEEETSRKERRKTEGKPSTSQAVAWGAAALGILGAIGAAAVVVSKSKSKK